MTETPVPRVAPAPDDVLPEVLRRPPWTVRPAAGPVVLKGLKKPRLETDLTWLPGEREEWLEYPYDEEKRGKWAPRLTRLRDDTDWEALADVILSGRALTEYEGQDRAVKVLQLLMQGPVELGLKVIDDERYSAEIDAAWCSQGLAARYEMAALPSLLRLARKQVNRIGQLLPFRDFEIAQLVLKEVNDHYRGAEARAWFERHGPEGVVLIVPDVVRRPGPKRTLAEEAVRIAAGKHGHAAVVEAVRVYGDEAAAAVAALKVDALDLYPDELPPIAEEHQPARLPQILLRDRTAALSDEATRHFLTMLAISTPDEPYAGVDLAAEACDPGSLAEFAWALYVAERGHPKWASPGVRYALERFGDDTTVTRLAGRVQRWDREQVWRLGGVTALDVFGAVGTDTALLCLHRLATKARDTHRMRPWAEGRLKRAAQERGLTGEQLADRLVPDLGLDAGGGMTLDYGPRRFTVGFDEQLRPYVADESGKHRKTLPKPGAKDDAVLAPAAYRAFTDLKKEARTAAADQIKRLEQAMVSGRRWTPAEFGELFLAHPLIRHIARRLVWSAAEDGKTTTFRVAEDRTLADVDDEVFTLSATADVGLPHPVRLGGELAAWAEVFADYEILQPFPQLGRVVPALAEGEGADGRLHRFTGHEVHYGVLLGLTRRGWALSEKETGGFQRSVYRKLSEERSVVIDIEPGIRVIGADEFATQEIREVALFTGRYARTAHPFGTLDPVVLAETLADLETLAP
ncbi:DUF4132 domain-containing protein [Spirillospora sp. NPDC047279]|uniref:DUF4132 domain-containing protein n=1 Tax=Spirillospora sp. NPDC047279 TaxID=3155478 RepID=UPI0033C44A2C